VSRRVTRLAPPMPTSSVPGSMRPAEAAMTAAGASPPSDDRGADRQSGPEAGAGRRDGSDPPQEAWSSSWRWATTVSASLSGTGLRWS
jgi:hypothetical protein